MTDVPWRETLRATASSWRDSLAANGGRCGLSGCLGHCLGCGARYEGSLCHGPPCRGCRPQPARDEERPWELTAQDIELTHLCDRVLGLVSQLSGGKPRPPDQRAWVLALRAENIAEMRRRDPALPFLSRGEELKHELIVITVVLEQVYGLPMPERWGLKP